MKTENGTTWQDYPGIGDAARNIAYVTAVLTTIFGGLYLLGLIGKFIVDGSLHSTSSQGVQILSASIAILLDLSLLILFTAIRRLITSTNLVYADLALVFMTLVCATSSINWFVQLAVMPKINPDSDPILISLLDIHNTKSLMYTMEHLGWGLFYGVATICMAVVVNSGKLELWIRRLLVTGGILSIIHVFGVIASNQVISDLGLIAWGILLPVTSLLFAIRFHRNGAKIFPGRS